MLGSNLEQVYKEVPMELLPEEYLPDDYTGPTAGSLQTIKGYFSEICRIQICSQNPSRCYS